MSFQELREAAPQCSRAVTVYDADLRGAGEGSLVEKFIHAPHTFFNSAADEVNLFAWWLHRRLRANGDTLRQDRFLESFVADDGGDVRERDFHSQRAGFDLGAGVVAAPDRYRRREATHADTRTRNEVALQDRLR